MTTDRDPKTKLDTLLRLLNAIAMDCDRDGNFSEASRVARFAVLLMTHREGSRVYGSALTELRRFARRAKEGGR